MNGPFDILVVEDAEAHAELIERAFEQAGEKFHIRVAVDLAGARAAIGQHTPALVIADNNLPDGHGIELADPAADYPLVVMTSHGDEAAAVGAMKAGALDYLVKNVEMLLDLPHIAERALREWGHIVERRRAEAELRQREAELRHAQKLEAIGRLASGVAHDFNNVLMGISGCVDVAVSKLSTEHPARRHLAEVIASARRASSITARLLAFGRRGELEHARLELDELMRETAVIVRRLLPADVELELDLSSCALVEGDAGQLEQVVLNLAANARDAMPDGGRLVLSTRAVERDDRAWVMLTVADTGQGMDEATRARVFEPFFTTKPVGRGTGLGLATAYGIIRQHGGDIELESAPGRGTTFRIHLPRAHGEASSTAAAAAELATSNPPASPRTVLVVEDEPLVREPVVHYLRSAGHSVIDAADADQARRILLDRARTIDLLITDVVLPGGGGASVAEAARATRPHLAVLYMSAQPSEVLALEGRLPPGTPVLQKPFSADALRAAVERAVVARPLSVLLVEDDRMSRLAITELLADVGVDVFAAATGGEALSRFQVDPAAVDIVVTDFGLPDVAGDALVAQLRAMNPKVAALYLTGRSRDDPALRRAIAEPLTALVAKPASIDEVLGAIRALMSRSRPDLTA